MRQTKLLFVIGLIVMMQAPQGLAQPERDLVPVFESAGGEFNVPSSLLKGIAFVETRWQHIRPETQAESHHNMPPAYGVMGLRNDAWFGHSLTEAARLIGLPTAVVKDDIRQNIRGAAALLADYASRETIKPINDNLVSWFDVVAKFPGIPQRELQGSYAERVCVALHEGYDQFGIAIERHAIDLDEVAAIRNRDYPSEFSFSPMSDDYGPAVWDASPNYSSRSGSAITHVIVHDTEGSFDGSVSWLKNPVAQASAHYIFRSADGFLKQLVRESDKAWHVVCWNAWTIGIEHEGYVSNPAFFTPIMYQQSASLVRHLTERYGISRNRLRIVGHNAWQSSVIFPQLGWDNCNNHTDPGQFWNWDYYLSLIVLDSSTSTVTGANPTSGQANVPVYKNIVIKFDRPMDIFSTQAAFSLFPDAAGTFRWSADAKTMTYDPTVNLNVNEPYIVSIANSAKSVGGGRLSSTFQFAFTTSPLDTVGPRITQSYPVQNAVNINPGVAFQIRFDEPVVFSTFSGRVRFVDVADSNTFLGIGNVTYVDVDDKGLLLFTPSADLQYGHTYRLRFLPGLKDPLNNSSSFESRVEFTVQSSPIVQGATIESFETNAGRWQQPSIANGSNKIDSTHSSFSIASNYKRTGVYSGKLAYAFTDTIGGICRLRTASPIPVLVANDWIGVWVFGDNSNNHLEFRFNPTAGPEQVVLFGNVNWFGWNFVTVPITGLMSALNSIVVKQTNGSSMAGALYFDDLQVRISTGVRSEDGVVHRSFALYQNYPNPFNPTTRIAFDLERPEETSLMVYNVLGQHVATLLNKPLKAGHHHVEFSGRGSDGAPLPSGVYLYRLQTSAGVEVKKMLLTK